MSKNAGVTLIELVVVVAILGILTSGGVLTYSIVNRANTDAAVKHIDSSLEDVKVASMCKEVPSYLAIFKSQEEKYPGFYVEKTTDIEKYTPNFETAQKVATKNIKITIVFSDGIQQEVDEKMVFLSFDRASGSIRPCYFKKEGCGVEEGSLPVSIELSGGDKTKKITMITETGKHFVE